MSRSVAPAGAASADVAAVAATGNGRRLLLVAPTEYDASVAKGVDGLLRDFDEKGFFDRVVMVFPFTRHNRVVGLGAGLAIHEFGIPGPSLLRQVLGPLHILRVVWATARLARRDFEGGPRRAEGGQGRRGRSGRHGRERAAARVRAA